MKDKVPALKKLPIQPEDKEDICAQINTVWDLVTFQDGDDLPICSHFIGSW